MPKAIDITNKRFGNLVALSKAKSKSGKTYWLCQCDCGNQKEVQTCHLTGGKTTSCGCLSTNKPHKVVAYRKRIKIALVASFSNKCCSCGLEDNPVLYDFHHLNPEEKEFGISNASTTRSKQAYANEAKKCIMLCSNCHRRLENDLISINDIEPIFFDENIYYQTLEDLI